MAKPTAEPLLDLDTLIKRPFIVIDGKRFDTFSPDELSVIQNHRFIRWGERIRELHQQSGKKAEDELDALVDTAARAVLVEIDDETFSKLSGKQRLAITEVFTARLLRSAMDVAGAMHRAAGTTPQMEQALGHPMGAIGASSSLGLPGSTHAARASFWRKLRLWWFGA
ncbi:MAG: hypothetical protein AAFZ11_01005 [Pseudomonadota bacterium]